MRTQLTTQLSLVTSGRATYLPATLHHPFSHCLFIGGKDDLLISPTHHHQLLCAGGGEQGEPVASTHSCTHRPISISPKRLGQARRHFADMKIEAYAAGQAALSPKSGQRVH